jgi:predicted ester cyclase
MTLDENKAVARRMVLEVFGQKNLAVIDEIVADDFIDHSGPPGMPHKGPESPRAMARMLTTAFPDSENTIQLEIAEGDLVVLHGTTTGTHQGELFGVPPTGQRATWSQTHIVRVVNGKIVEHWADVDRLTMLQQLGVIPEPTPSR